jgi:hypothetical protein
MSAVLPGFLKALSTFFAEQTPPFVLHPGKHFGAGFVAKTDWAKFVRWVRPERGANHRAAGGERPPRHATFGAWKYGRVESTSPAARGQRSA